MSGVGFGQLGLVSGAPDFLNIVRLPGYQKQVRAEFRPGKQVTGWNIYAGGGNTFVAPVRWYFDGYYHDVSHVSTSREWGLRRVESVTECEAIPGSFFYYNPASPSSKSWDDGGLFWDEASPGSWDEWFLLYVHLSDGGNPEEAGTVAHFSIYTANGGSLQANLSAPLNIDPHLEDWSDSTHLNYFTEHTTNAAVVRSATTREGIYSAYVGATYGSTSVDGGVSFSRALISGCRYRVSVRYLLAGVMDYASKTTVPIKLRVGIPASSRYALIGGIGYDSTSTGLPVSFDVDEWCHLTFDFLAWETNTFEFKFGAVGDGGINLLVGRFAVYRIWSYSYDEPRLASSAIPSMDIGLPQVVPGPKRVGLGTITIMNQDGWLDQALQELVWFNKPALVSVGGDIPGIQMTSDEYQPQFSALMQRPETGDNVISLSLEDLRTVLHKSIPFRQYNKTNQQAVPSDKDGAYRPILLGRKLNITPTPIDYVGSFFRYEVCDTYLSPAGMNQIEAIYLCVDDDSARSRTTLNRLMFDGKGRVLLVAGTDYSEDLNTGSFVQLRDLRLVKIIDDQADTLNYSFDTHAVQQDFKSGYSPFTYLNQDGLYQPAKIAAHLQLNIQHIVDTFGGGYVISVTYDETSRKFTIAKSAGTLELLLSIDTGNLWKSLGFTGNDDLTGLLSYTSDAPVFEVASSSDLILRVDAKGWQDDSLGTYTGTPGSVIQNGASWAKLAWVAFLGLPAYSVDPVRLKIGVSSAYTLALYIKDQISTLDLFDIIERSCLADLTIDGGGVLRFVGWQATSSLSSKVTIEEREISLFEEDLSYDDIATSWIVKHNQNPTTGDWSERRADSVAVGAKYQIVNPKSHETAIVSGDEAQAVANLLKQISESDPKLARVTVPFWLGYLYIGDKVSLVRTRRPMGSGRSLGGGTYEYRIRKLRQEWPGVRATLVLTSDINL